MGTSKGIPTPSGGAWTPLKNHITRYLGGDRSITPKRLVGGTIAATGGLSGGGAAKSGGVGGRGVGDAVAGVGGFAAAVREGGLDGALSSFDLDELRHAYLAAIPRLEII